MISQLAELFSDSEAMEKLFLAQTKRQIEDVIANY
jgi:PTS system ascorbate-specific IIA component